SRRPLRHKDFSFAQLIRVVSLGFSFRNLDHNEKFHFDANFPSGWLACS
ncbi:unnamed protein product, partial [Rotaria sp. Silwood2]